MNLPQATIDSMLAAGATVGPAPRLPGAGKARGRTARHEPGRMNRTEAKYARDLDARVDAGEVLRYWFEAVKLRLADRTYFTPDFLVQLDNGLVELHEVKGGFIEDDAAVKIKVAAELYPLFTFRLFIQRKGGFQERAVGNQRAEL